MAAYCLFDNLSVSDRVKLEEYKIKVAPIVEKFQGKYTVIGGQTEVIEGSWETKFLVMIEFPNLHLAREWYNSADYRELKALRFSVSRSNAIMMEGL